MTPHNMFAVGVALAVAICGMLLGACAVKFLCDWLDYRERHRVWRNVERIQAQIDPMTRSQFEAVQIAYAEFQKRSGPAWKRSEETRKERL